MTESSQNPTGESVRAKPVLSHPLVQIALRTSLLYWVVAVAYILLSDRAVEALFSDPVTAGRVQTFKGWGFVTITALLLYVSLRGQLRRWEREATERRRAEEALRTRMTQIHAILAHQPIAFFACDLEGVITLWEGRTWPEIKFPPADVVGRKVQALGGEGPEFRAAIGRALQGETVAVEHRMLTRTFEIFHTPLNDAAGRRAGTSGVVVDITERTKLEAQLLRAQRLESVGRLAGGVAHDLNNMLAPVIMGAEMMREGGLTPDQRSLLDTMQASAQRGASIIRQLLVFSRGAEGDRGPVMLKALVTEMRNLVRETFPRNIVVRTAVAEGALVRADATQLHQVLLNLCVNARDALPDGGEINLVVEFADVDAAEAQNTPGAVPGRYVVLMVRDTGTGIVPEHLDRIFDPFFTTKAVGIGTGLGLSTVLGIVKSHGGFIEVRSRPGEGACFRVYLPAIESTPVTAVVPPPAELPRGQGECILVVEDEKSVRVLVRQALEYTGYRVIEAEDGAHGVVQFGRQQAEVQLVVTDLMMPVMDGVGFVRALREVNGKMPVIAMTGVGHSAKVEEMRQLGVQSFLEKPFTADALVRAVHCGLQARAPVAAGPAG